MSLRADWHVLQRRRRQIGTITGYVKEQILLTSLDGMISRGRQAHMLTNNVVNTRALLQSSALVTLLCLKAVFPCLCIDKTPRIELSIAFQIQTYNMQNLAQSTAGLHQGPEGCMAS